jgi:hypothetical protein
MVQHTSRLHAFGQSTHLALTWMLLPTTAANNCSRTVLAGVAKARFGYSDGDYPIAAPATGCSGDSTGVW